MTSQSASDARAWAKSQGCRCGDCPLNYQTPVLPDRPKRALLTIVGEAPGSEEDELGQVFVGATGGYVESVLDEHDLVRSQIHLTNTVLCFPRVELSTSEWKTAIECCKPRLEKELATGPEVVLACGKRSLQALAEKHNITDWFGMRFVREFRSSPTSRPKLRKVWFNFHPTFAAFRTPELRPVFSTVFERALLDAEKRLAPWKYPAIHVSSVPPDGDKFLEALELQGIKPTTRPLTRSLEALRDTDLLGVDIETRKDGSLICLGVASRTLAVSIPWPLINGERQALEELFRNPKIKKVLHNASFDIIRLEKEGFTFHGEILDTMALHGVVASQLRHALSIVCAIEFYGPRWKSIYGAASDVKGMLKFERAPLSYTLIYNALDNWYTVIACDRLLQRAAEMENGLALVKDVTEKQAICLELERYGLPIDEPRRETMKRKIHKRRLKLKRRLVRHVSRLGIQRFNPASNPDLHNLFFKKLGIHAVRYSKKTGKPSLDGDALIPLTRSKDTRLRQLVKDLLEWRSLGVDRNTLSMTIKDGYLHPVGRSYGAKSGRWTFNPNIQNLKPFMRQVFTADAGGWLLECDKNALELRITAMFAKDPLLKEWFDAGLKVHNVNCKRWFNVDSPNTEQKTAVKQTVYALDYGAIAETIHAKLITEFPDMPLALVQFIAERWFEEHPWIERLQHKWEREAETTMYSVAPLSRRKIWHYIPGRIDRNRALNHPIQATGSDILDPELKAIVSEIGFSKRERLLAQIHDSLLFTTHRPYKLAQIVERHMHREITYDGFTMDYPIAFKVGRRWGEMHECSTLAELKTFLKSDEARRMT